jgi:cell division protein FtsI (penicillin-binding protein 3)
MSDGPVAAAKTEPSPPKKKPAGKDSAILNMLPEKMLATFRSGSHGEQSDAQAAQVTPKIVPAVQVRGDGGVVVDASRRVAVPSFAGGSLRTVVEHADQVGLRVQPLGSGLAREQAPAPGTMVPAGTEVVVRFAR